MNMENKKELLIMIRAIEIGLKNKDKEKVRNNIIKFLEKPEMKIETKKGIFLDENNEPIQMDYVKSLPTNELIEMFKDGLNEFKEFVKNG